MRVWDLWEIDVEVGRMRVEYRMVDHSDEEWDGCGPAEVIHPKLTQARWHRCLHAGVEEW